MTLCCVDSFPGSVFVAGTKLCMPCCRWWSTHCCRHLRIRKTTAGEWVQKEGTSAEGFRNRGLGRLFHSFFFVCERDSSDKQYSYMGQCFSRACYCTCVIVRSHCHVLYALPCSCLWCLFKQKARLSSAESRGDTTEASSDSVQVQATAGQLSANVDQLQHKIEQKEEEVKLYRTKYEETSKLVADLVSQEACKCHAGYCLEVFAG